MYAIEFEADVKDFTIAIPREYQELESKHVKIFVVEVANKKTQIPQVFLNPIVIDSYDDIATREDIYER